VIYLSHLTTLFNLISNIVMLIRCRIAPAKSQGEFNVILNVIIDDKTYPIEVADEDLDKDEKFFLKMDSDMDQGWQVSRNWIEKPDSTQRCQIAADKLLTAINKENEALVTLMVGYILTRSPGVTTVNIDTNGEILETELS